MTPGSTAPPDTSSTAPRTRPFTGAEYSKPAGRPRDLDLRRARQGRHDASGIPQHGADDCAPLRRACTIPRARRSLTTETDTGSGGYHPQVLSARRETPRRWSAARDAIAEWARITYGWIGRSPDYKAAFHGDARRQLGFLRAVRSEREGAGIRRFRRKSRSSITPSSIRRSIATSRSTR